MSGLYATHEYSNTWLEMIEWSGGGDRMLWIDGTRTPESN